MKLKVKRFDKNLPLPEYKTDKAAALDLYARVDTTIFPHKVGYVPLNIALELPQNHWALLAARSSLHKKGLMMANGIGVGDEDFCGDNDEYQSVLFNFTDQEVECVKDIIFDHLKEKPEKTKTNALGMGAAIGGVVLPTVLNNSGPILRLAGGF
jgi:dUTP pyrophosphatase